MNTVIINSDLSEAFENQEKKSVMHRADDHESFFSMDLAVRIWPGSLPREGILTLTQLLLSGMRKQSTAVLRDTVSRYSRHRRGVCSHVCQNPPNPPTSGWRGLGVIPS